MVEQKAFQQRIQKIEGLIAKLDESGDPNLQACAKDLVRLIMDLHGAGLEAMMQIVSQAGDAGHRMVERFDRDDLIRSLLLLYGLHPLDFETRVRRAIEKAGPSLDAHGTRVEVLGLADGMIRLRLFGSGLKGCGASGVKSAIEEAIYEAAPDLTGLEIEVVEPPSSTFVPLASLLNHPAPVAAMRGTARP